jgi:hypothetical protein
MIRGPKYGASLDLQQPNPSRTRSRTAWPGDFLSAAVTAQSSDFGFGGSRRLMGADSFLRMF